jgi:transposase
MIQITPQMRILISVEPVDFRKGIDGMVRLCREVMKSDPFSGYVFVFGNRKRTAIKVLMYDGQGFWLCHKRLSEGRFLWWPKRNDRAVSKLAAYDLQLLLWNGDPTSARVAPIWKEVQLPE